MIQIEDILVIRDPRSPRRNIFELTIQEVREYGESFFRKNFHAEVTLTDGTCYSFIKISDNSWEWVPLIDDDFDVNLGEGAMVEGTFEQALDLLLNKVNTQPGEN